MSDIKKVLSVFIPPVYSSKHQGMQNALFDGNHTVIGIMDSKIEAEKLADMINSHDALVEQNKALKAALERIILANRTDCGGGFLTYDEVDISRKALEKSR